MKLFIFILCLTLAGCDFWVTIQEHELDAANEICANHGGVDEITAYNMSSSVRVFCNDGFRSGKQHTIKVSE